MKLKTALIIAPHPDDEINIAGQLIVTLNRLKVNTYIMFMTNGDATIQIGNKRLVEAINALEVLGIRKNNIIFLGYPNEWSSPLHIYNAEPEKEMISRCGKTITNGLDICKDYIYQKEKVHHKFTKNNLKNDMKYTIQEIKADLLVCNDFDVHPDHRAASLLFEEIMGEILKEDIYYRPIILKKFAYAGVWTGKKDYHSIPMEKTKQPDEKYYANGFHELEAPQYHWKDRICFETDPVTKTEYLRKNILYQVARKHKSTIAWYQMLRVINADMVYWWRPVNNLMFNAGLLVSSGEKKYLDDFKYYDSDDVTNENEPIGNSSSYAWIPDEQDEKKQITIFFEQKVVLEQIIFFEDCNYDNHILNLIIELDGKERIESGELMQDGSATKVTLDPKRTVFRIAIIIDKWIGVPAITEIELYSQVPDFLKSGFPIHPMTEKKTIKSGKSFGQRLELLWLNIEFLFKFKIKYELSRRFKMDHFRRM